MSGNPERIILRQATARDRNAAITLIHELNVVETAYSDDRRTDLAAAEAYYGELMYRLSNRDGRLIVAEMAAGGIAGLMGFCIERDTAYVVRERNRYGFVTDLVVHADWRGRGVGRRLLAEAERMTKEAGLKRLSIGVLWKNERAEALYRDFGFESYAKMLTKNY